MIKFFLVFILLIAVPGSAQEFKTPWLSGPIIDEVGLLGPQHRQEIEKKLYLFNNKGIAQVQVFITSSLQGFPIEQASIDIVEAWKLGDAKKDNGILFLVAPNERKVRIEVGQGLEGTLPDIYANRIIQNVVLPDFQQGQMSEGVYQGVTAVLGILQGERSIADYDSSAPTKQRIPTWVIVLFWLFIFIFFRIMPGGRRLRGRGAGWYGGGFGGGFGGGGFGGGGGWSGGGGGFSGGGASGSW